jgi:hypothetical protein
MKTHVQHLISLIFLLGFGNFILAQESLPLPSENSKEAFKFLPTDTSPLYEQVNSFSADPGVASQEFIDFPTYTCQAADDFIVPEGTTWMINEFHVPGGYSEGGGPANLVNVFIYQHNPVTNGPGNELMVFPGLPINPSLDGNLMMFFEDPVLLEQGHYWLAVQPVMSYTNQGQWFWWRQTAPTLNQEFKWKNPGGGFGALYPTNWLPDSQIPWEFTTEDHNLSFAIFGSEQGGNPPQNMSLCIGDYLNPEQWHDWIGGQNNTTRIQLFADNPNQQIQYVGFSWSMDGELWNNFYFDFDGASPNENSSNPSDQFLDGWSGYLPHIILPQSDFELMVMAQVMTFDGDIIEVHNSTMYDPTPPSGIQINLEDFMIITDDAILLDIDPGSCTDLFEVEYELVSKPEEFNKGIPGIQQPTNVTCAPTAAAACLKWFEGQGDDQITGGLSNTDLIDGLKEYCGTTASGTKVADLVKGLEEWIKDHGDGYTIRGPLPFDWKQMRNELEKGQDVLSGIYGTDVAHRMTFNSIKNRPEENGTIRIDFMDPWTGEEEYGYLDPETGEITGFTSSLLNSGTLGNTVIICPKESTALPGTGTFLPGPNPSPVSIPVFDPGLYFLRINALDQSGHKASFDLVLDKQQSQSQPSEDAFLRIGDWNIAEDWHNWIGGAGKTTHLQLFGYSDYPVEQVSFSYLLDDQWTPFYTDTDGYELPENTTGTGQDNGDGWSGYFPHDLIPLENMELWFGVEVLLSTGDVFEHYRSIKYDATPPDEFLINLEDFMIINGDVIELDIDPGNTNIQSVEVELVPKPEEFNKGVPGITQPTDVTCAPTAAAACLKWFEGQGDSDITGGLTNGALIDSLKKYCKTDADGTLPSDLANGLKKWIEGHGDGYTIRGPLDFDWTEMRNELERGQDVLSGIAWTGGGGHRMTFNSIKNRAEEDGKIRVDFMDPWTGQEEWGYLDTETGELTGFSSTSGDSGTLKGIIIICPKESTSLPGTGTVLPGPNPPPVSIPIDDPGLYFLRINVLDDDGNTSRLDLVMDRQLLPADDAFLRIGDWGIAEDWHNWIGGVDKTTHVQLFGYTDYPVEEVVFSYSLNDEWFPFYTDNDGFELPLNTIGSGIDQGDGWSGYFPHDLIPQQNIELVMRAEVMLSNGEIFEHFNSINYDATPPDAFSTNLEDFMIITEDAILLDIEPINTNIFELEVELVIKPEEFNKGVPDITQPDNATCAPTAAAACLKWFEGQGDNEITGGLSNSALIDSLKKYCKTDANGTDPSDWFNGLKKWIESHGDGYTIRGPLDFNWKQMRNELERGQDVLSGIYWTGGGGHAMTFNSIKNRPEPDGKIRVDFMDPWTGQQEWGYLDPATGKLTGYTSTAGNSGQLAKIIIICPKETTSLPGTGTVIPGPNPLPISIPIPEDGLYFLRINILDEDGNTSRLDLVMDRVLPPPLEQFVEIPAGWSGLSSYLIPSDPSLENIFGDVENDLTILYNFDGFYWPGQNTNTLGEWNSNSGYAIKMASDALLTFVGDPNPNPDIELNGTVSLLHIPTECGISTLELSGQLDANLIMVQEVATAKVYLPAYSIDQINQLMPGKAYYIWLADPPAIISFPDCGIQITSPQLKDQAMDIDSPWGVVKPTPLSHQLVFSDEAQMSFDKNDLIGVFDGNGILVGLSRVTEGEPMSISAFGDDQYTETKDGLVTDESLDFVVYKSDLDIFYRLLPEYGSALPNQGSYVQFGLSEISGFKLEPIAVDETTTSDLRIFPNPSEGRFTIEQLADERYDSFEIIDIRGTVLLSGDLSQKAELDLISFEKGMYFIKLKGQQHTDLRKIVLR